MTTGTDLTKEIFQDARELQADALEMLARGRTRNGAEKACGRRRALLTPWCWAAPAMNRNLRERRLTGHRTLMGSHRPWQKHRPVSCPWCCFSMWRGQGIPGSVIPRTDLISQEPQNARVWFEAHSTGS